MDASVKTYRVPTDTIDYAPLEIARLLGYPGPAPDPVEKTMRELWTEASQHIRAMCGYRWIQKDVKVGAGRFRIQEATFNCGALISRHLEGCTGIALFTASLGPDYQSWSKHFFEDLNDPYQGYLSDAIGSIFVESVAAWLARKLQTEIGRQGLKPSNRLSPGYCQWSVAEQHKLFALLPEAFCGIELTESALMIPIKSVSGIIGTGPSLQKEAYACDVCDMEHCMMRRPR